MSLTIPSRVELFGKDKLTKALEEKAEAFRIYGGYASYILYQSVPTLLAELHETGMEDLYREMELPLYSPSLAGAEGIGWMRRP